MAEQDVKAKVLTAGGAGQSPLGTRTIGQIKFEDDRSVLKKLPVDMVMTMLHIRLSGWFTPEWDTGTPTANSKGVLDALIEFIKVEASSKTEKKLTPEQIRFLQKTIYAKASKAWHKVNSKELKGASQSNFSFGTTGQSIAVSEVISIPFALINSIVPELTYFDTSRHLQTNLEIQTHSMKNLVKGGDATNFRVTDHDLRFHIHAETSDADLGKPFLRNRQTYTEEVFQSASKEKRIDIQRNSKLMGLSLELVKVSKSDGTMTDCTIDEAHGAHFAIIANGQTQRRSKIAMADQIAVNTTLTDLIEAYQNRCYVPLAQYGDVDSAEVSSLYNSYELEVELDGDLLDFTNYDYKMFIHFDEVLN